MRGTSCANLQIDTYPTPASLPPEASALLDDKSNLFATLSWWQVVGSHAIPSGGEALFVTIRNPERIMAVIPMVRSGRRLSSLTTPYTCLYQPRLAAGLTHPERYAAIEGISPFRTFRRHHPLRRTSSGRRQHHRSGNRRARGRPGLPSLRPLRQLV